MLTTVNLSEVGELTEDGAVAKRNEDDTVVNEGGHRRDDGGF